MFVRVPFGIFQGLGAGSKLGYWPMFEVRAYKGDVQMFHNRFMGDEPKFEKFEVRYFWVRSFYHFCQ